MAKYNACCHFFVNSAFCNRKKIKKANPNERRVVNTLLTIPHSRRLLLCGYLLPAMLSHHYICRNILSNIVLSAYAAQIKKNFKALGLNLLTSKYIKVYNRLHNLDTVQISFISGQVCWQP